MSRGRLIAAFAVVVLVPAPFAGTAPHVELNTCSETAWEGFAPLPVAVFAEVRDESPPLIYWGKGEEICSHGP